MLLRVRGRGSARRSGWSQETGRGGCVVRGAFSVIGLWSSPRRSCVRACWGAPGGAGCAPFVADRARAVSALPSLGGRGVSGLAALAGGVPARVPTRRRRTEHRRIPQRLNLPRSGPAVTAAPRRIGVVGSPESSPDRQGRGGANREVALADVPHNLSVDTRGSARARGGRRRAFLRRHLLTGGTCARGR